MSEKLPNVLIVDDEYYLGQMLAKALINNNINATAVTEVDSAIDLVKKTTFDLVVSDIFLPEKSGVDLFNYVQNNGLELPFIFMTGNPDLEMAVSLLTHGGYDYIIKPFMIPDFIKKVSSVIDTHNEKKKEKRLVKDLRQLLDKRLSELKIYQDIFDSTDEGVIILDIDGYIVKVNQGFEIMTGLKPANILQEPLVILKKFLLPDLRVKEILQTLKKGNNWHGELRGHRNKNKIWYTHASFFSIEDESNEIFAYAAIFNDVTTQRKVKQELISSLKKTNLAQEAIIFGLAKLAEHRDNITGFHLERLRNYCKAIAEELKKRDLYPKKINYEFIQMIYRIAPLHDIGKVGIPDQILLKKDRLSEAEYDLIKSHTLMGYKTLNSIKDQYGEMPFIKMGIEVTYCHHERWDGKGYPRGLKGEEIPLSAQILSVADVYDALTTSRSYKQAYNHEKSLGILMKERGKQFSPVILDAFFDIADQINEIRENYAEQGIGEFDTAVNQVLSY